MADYNLALVADRSSITSVVDYINNDVYNKADGTGSENQQDAISVEYWYDKMLLDKIKLSNSEYVYLKYADTKEVPKGHQKYFLRRWGGLHAHTTPLIEGMPPKSDKTMVESFEGTFNQYGRYMEFTDKVDFDVLDPVIMEYTSEMGDVATRTFERLARNEMLNSTFEVYANSKQNVGELELGDEMVLGDYRLAALQMKRLLVKPIGSVFKVIISEEHKYDLLEDDSVREYYGVAYTPQNQGFTAGGGRLETYGTGEIPTLFGISFETTMLDDYAYGYELSNPGEWADENDKVQCRVYKLNDLQTGYDYYNLPSGKRTVYVSEEYRTGVNGDAYADIPGITEDPEGRLTEEATENTNRLTDGSWIPVRTVWDTNVSVGTDTTAVNDTVLLKWEDTTIDTSKWAFSNTDFVYHYDNTDIHLWLGEATEDTFTIGLDTENNVYVGYIAGTAALTGANYDAAVPSTIAVDYTGDYEQLPVHVSIMLGKDALIKAGISGRGGAQMFVKQLGTAGVLDPINQRQSIGFKIDTVGFNLLRNEACWVFRHVPSNATLTANIGRNHTMGLQKPHNTYGGYPYSS